MTRLPHRAPRVPEDVLADWSRRGLRTGEGLGDMLERGARRWPHRPAVITAEGTWTFARLAARSDEVARALTGGGVRPGNVVSWMLPTGPDAIAVAAAVWRIGAVSSPIVPVYGPREIAAVLDQVGPTALVTWHGPDNRRDHADELDTACRETGVSPAVRLLTTGRHPGWTRLDDAPRGVLPSIETRPDDPCLVLFTSGTESLPKGVLHSVAGVSHELRSTIAAWGLTFRDTMVMASPMTHITGLLQGFLIPAKVGAAALLMDRWDPEQGVALIEEWAATYMAGATPFLRELLDAYERQGLASSSLVQYCCGGASVPSELVRRADALGIAAYRCWGMTELPTATLASELDDLTRRATTDGPLAPGVELRVVDDAGAEVPPGTEGHLLLRGPEMMLGYVRDDADAAAFTPDGWLRTGDLGRLNPDGYLTVTGRAKDIVNRGGEKFSVREIEEAVATHPDVAAVAVVAVPGGRLGERVGAAVVSRRADLTIEEIGGSVTGAGLARQKQPEIVALVDSIPTNATGKVDRAAVRRLVEATGEARS